MDRCTQLICPQCSQVEVCVVKGLLKKIPLAFIQPDECDRSRMHIPADELHIWCAFVWQHALASIYTHAYTSIFATGFCSLHACQKYRPLLIIIFLQLRLRHWETRDACFIICKNLCWDVSIFFSHKVTYNFHYFKAFVFKEFVTEVIFMSPPLSIDYTNN